ncbi:hypothetical protein [Treponema saccharophilum]|uniref:Major outer membrane protein n=1 Tax=Treponema saccharophilum DSM 2985 TaxID=907348 RepID=H7EPX0_9SPIR|nr:hypothetical protein [Treponema saccharophilum]EIC00521.1 hypothetical protein TresaDRAFT_0615 [Treponema saccharophilum DSM 2985]BDC95055.1 hypothetical protein TRSA_01540 [Treponema saccharophilum]
MKKVITVAALAAAVAGLASADISFGSWGRGLWITAANSGDGDIVTDVHQSWGGNAPRTALAVSGDSDNVGFKLDIHGNGTDFGMGDNAYIWVKPIEQVKLYMGKLDVNALRSDVAYGLWNWDRLGCVNKRIECEGWTFPAFVKGNGVSIQATPVEGLTLVADIPLNLDGTAKKFSDTYGRSAKYAAAYDIKDVGTFKLGLETKARATKVGETESKENVQIDVAFDVSAVENASISVGARIPTLNGATTDGGYNNPYVTLGGSYKADALTAHLLAGVAINAADKKENKDDALGFSFGVGADYDLGEGLGVFADVRYANGIWQNSSSADHMDSLVFGLGVEKGWSNGKIGIAFEGATNNGGRYPLKNAYFDENDKFLGVGEDFSWEIPVKFEYWF